MRKSKLIKNCFLLSFYVLFMASCASNKYLDMAAPEESGLNLMKITDESSNSVMGNAKLNFVMKNTFAYTTVGGCKNSNIYWATGYLLDVSPDGTELAYASNINKQINVMVRKAGPQSAATQRTFRNVYDFSWGDDGNLYFADNSDIEKVQIGVTNAHSGSLMRQLTNNNLDLNPVVTKDGKIVFFTRVDKSGPSIWSLNLENGSLTSCARGYNPCLLGDRTDSFICVRNSTAGVSEIWLVNYIEGKETLILSDKNRGFTNPSISPDGEWILCQGNSKSAITKKNNLDLFVVKLDGTNFLQLTYHPAEDCCPRWSADGKYIYFVSSRANKDDYFNIWRMKFVH